jgi:methylenetetrahydrofolate dehydrogenase (NADP+)/methenyltetrahydrofolate cyclohydrolase
LVARVLDGKVVSADVKAKVKKAVDELKKVHLQPCLATVLVGDDPASSTYVSSKQKDAKEVGIMTKDHRLGSATQEAGLVELVQQLNKDPTVHGILVQLPLPPHINESEVISTISPLKDVDGLTPVNAGLLQGGLALVKPCTPAGVMELLDYYKIDVTGMDAVIVNRSRLVGKPLAIMLLERNATVTICHSKTNKLEEKLRSADLIVTAVGKREQFTLTAGMIKIGAIVIDIGTSKVDGKIAGDVDFESVKHKASWITPVPGGVGLMTRAMLLKNTVSVAAASKEMRQ